MNVVLVVAALVSMQAPSMTTTTTPCRVLVLDPVGPSVSLEQRALIGAALSEELGRHSACRVVGAADVRALVETEATLQSCGTESESCLTELGQALGAEQIIAGEVHDAGNGRIALNARQLDIGTAEIIERAELVVAADADALRRGARRLARRLLHLDDRDLIAASPLFLPGVVASVVGGVGLVAGTVTAAVLHDQLGKAERVGTDKSLDIVLGRVGVITAVAGGIVVVAGVTLLLAGGGE